VIGRIRKDAEETPLGSMEMRKHQMKSGTTGSGEECRHVNQETGTMKIGR
jgi:hypothetical protein